MFYRTLQYATYAIIAFGLSGCAREPSNPNVDPYENMNRAIFGFNKFIDTIALKPAAKVYNFIVPTPIQMGVSNAFDNIGEARTFANDILQGRLKYAFSDIGRLLINSTIGLGGLFDVASHMGIPKHYEDFGMTLAYWEGGKPSPYLVLPILGPDTFRSSFGKIADFYSAPWPYLKNQTIGYITYGLDIINTRSSLLPADKLIDTSFDPYIFVRNAYLQKRNRMIKLNDDLDKNINTIKADNGTLSAKDYGANGADTNSDIYVSDDVANAPIDGVNNATTKVPTENTKAASAKIQKDTSETSTKTQKVESTNSASKTPADHH